MNGICKREQVKEEKDLSNYILEVVLTRLNRLGDTNERACQEGNVDLLAEAIQNGFYPNKEL